MSYSEREALTSLITTLIVVAFFAWRLSSQHVQGLFTGPEALQVWARSVLVLVVIGIGIAIAVTVVFHVLYAALTGAMNGTARSTAAPSPGRGTSCPSASSGRSSIWPSARPPSAR